jgi:hypothetical protein
MTKGSRLGGCTRRMVFNVQWLSSKFVHVSQRLRILTAGAFFWPGPGSFLQAVAATQGRGNARP